VVRDLQPASGCLLDRVPGEVHPRVVTDRDGDQAAGVVVILHGQHIGREGGTGGDRSTHLDGEPGRPWSATAKRWGGMVVVDAVLGGGHVVMAGLR
jgi:hypothetical protein